MPLLDSTHWDRLLVTALTADHHASPERRSDAARVLAHQLAAVLPDLTLIGPADAAALEALYALEED